MNRTTRREALTAGLLTALAGVAAVAAAKPDQASAQPVLNPHPDAELIALCDEIAAIERQWSASVDVSGEMSCHDPRYAAYEAHETALTKQQDPLIERLNDLPTHTLDGFRARAQLIVVCDYDELVVRDDHRGMVWALISALAEEQPGAASQGRTA